jgi:hypothetical protein
VQAMFQRLDEDAPSSRSLKTHLPVSSMGCFHSRIHSLSSRL